MKSFSSALMWVRWYSQRNGGDGRRASGIGYSDPGKWHLYNLVGETSCRRVPQHFADPVFYKGDRPKDRKEVCQACNRQVRKDDHPTYGFENIRPFDVQEARRRLGGRR